jgi:hypothetical protein
MPPSRAGARDVALARAAVADGDDIFAPLDVFGARQLQYQRFVKRWQRQEVEAVEAFNGREPRRLDPAVHHAPLAINHLHLGQPHQVTRMVDAFSRTQPGKRRPYKKAEIPASTPPGMAATDAYRLRTNFLQRCEIGRCEYLMLVRSQATNQGPADRTTGPGD